MTIAHHTFVYKRVNDLEISFDLYAPVISSKSPRDTPVLVYFHGGGLTVGNRYSNMPFWLIERITQAGITFISADYRLLIPCTGHDIIDDILDLFHFFRHNLNAELRILGVGLSIDVYRIGVAGSSAGGLCAYLAAVHVHPKPRIVVSFYGMGGDFLSPHYLVPKTKPFFRGRDLLDPTLPSFTPYTHPADKKIQPTAVAPLVYDRNTGYPLNPRMLLARLQLQLGTFLDYYTGQPSLSSILRRNPLEIKIPEPHKRLFPQFLITPDFPPTFLCHGALDSAVLVHESVHLATLLPDVKLIVVDGQEHSFDFQPGAVERYGDTIFSDIVEFIKEGLRAEIV